MIYGKHLEFRLWRKKHFLQLGYKPVAAMPLFYPNSNVSFEIRFLPATILFDGIKRRKFLMQKIYLYQQRSPRHIRLRVVE